MGCLMNLLWLLLGGIFTAVEYLISSILMMITIIGIPFGMQTLKLAGLALWPFGKEVRSGSRSGGCLYILMNAKMESLEDTDYYERLDYSFILLHDFRI